MFYFLYILFYFLYCSTISSRSTLASFLGIILSAIFIHLFIFNHKLLNNLNYYILYAISLQIAWNKFISIYGFNGPMYDCLLCSLVYELLISSLFISINLNQINFNILIYIVFCNSFCLKILHSFNLSLSEFI
jgi:hypothetical protein